MTSQMPNRNVTLFPVTRAYDGIDTPEDVVVLTHTAVGDDLRGIATRDEDAVEVTYTRSDVDAESFGTLVAGLPPVPNDTEYVTIGDDRHSTVWTAWGEQGIAISLEPDVNVPIPMLVRELKTLGLE